MKREAAPDAGLVAAGVDARTPAEAGALATGTELVAVPAGAPSAAAERTGARRTAAASQEAALLVRRRLDGTDRGDRLLGTDRTDRLDRSDRSEPLDPRMSGSPP